MKLRPELRICRQKLRKFAKKLATKFLLGVDVTSSMGAVEYNFSVADAWFFSVQKAFGMPAGLGILIVGPKILEKAKNARRKKSGRRLSPLFRQFAKNFRKQFLFL
jgi:Phosphoserine aminotransferase